MIHDPRITSNLSSFIIILYIQFGDVVVGFGGDGSVCFVLWCLRFGDGLAEMSW